MPDTTLSTLTQIRIKVRRLTRNPSVNQLSDADIDSYINNFVLYDMPAHLKLNTLTDILTFYTEPYIDTYETNTTDANNPLYNFKNEYTGVKGPIYISGIQSYLSFSKEEFNASYPKIMYKELLGVGDGVTTNFSGTLSDFPVLRNQVLISSINSNNGGLEAHDDGVGSFEGDVVAGGTIDYVTGDYDITYVLAPKDQENIYAQTVPYEPGKPTSCLFSNDSFTFKLVPDMPYKIDVVCYKRPTELLSDNQSPELAEYWQYIAYGAAKKIFDDKMDLESIQKIMPEFKQQEILINRRQIVQNAQVRSKTIYGEPMLTSLGFDNE